MASAYAKSRPTYPAAILDAIQELSGRPLSGARIADVGAGTGISSRQLLERGAAVTAVELSEPMLRQLVAQSPGVGAVRGSANALPLRDGSVDFVTFAQAWHWVNPDLAVPEVFRVLEPGGALACFWNTPTAGAPWRLGYDDRIRELIGGEPGYGNDSTALDQEPHLDLGEQWSHLPVQVFQATWSRRVTLEQRITNVMSRSYVSDVAAERLKTFLDNERAFLLKHFPDGMVLEEYTTWLGVAAGRSPPSGAPVARAAHRSGRGPDLVLGLACWGRHGQGGSAVLRRTLLAAAGSDRTRGLVERLPGSRQVVKRYVPGEATSDAVAATKVLIDDGLHVTLDHLGEDTLDARRRRRSEAYLLAARAAGGRRAAARTPR